MLDCTTGTRPYGALRHTFETRLYVGELADHSVTLKIRQGHAGVFQRYRQAKLMRMCEALEKLDPKANEYAGTSSPAPPN